MAKKKLCWVIASPLIIHFFLLGQIIAFAKKYDLTIITNTDDPDFLAYLNVSLTVIPVAIERNVSLWRDLKALLRLMIIFHYEKFDVVHSFSPKSGLLAMAASWLLRVPVRLHTFQGEVWVTRTGLWRAFLKLLDKWVALWATHLLVVSASEKQFLIEQGVIPAQKGITMLANGSICGVDTDRFKADLSLRNSVRLSLGIPEDDLVILYLGRLTVDKGLLDLADAFFRINAKYRHVHLLVVGPDEEDIQVKMEARGEYTESCLHFVGYTNVAEQYMATSDIFCLPSYREGFGMVLLEAAATGIPAVGSRIYGISDAIIESETGLLFDVADSEDLAEKLEILIVDADLRRELGEKGFMRVQRDFSKELVLAELMNYYELLV